MHEPTRNINFSAILLNWLNNYFNFTMDLTASTELKHDIKQLILDTLNIRNVKPEEIDDDIPLFSKENILHLDSIDGIELIMAIQKKYEVRIGDQNLARNVLESVNSIAEFVVKEKTANRETQI